MKISKMIIALSAIFAVSAANAAYSVKIYPEANIVFTNQNSGSGGSSEEKPTTPETTALTCEEMRSEIESLAAQMSLLISIKYVDSDKCQILVSSIENFGSKSTLVDFAQRIEAKQFDNFFVVVRRYYKTETTNKTMDFLMSNTTSYETGAAKIWSQYVYDRMF